MAFLADWLLRRANAELRHLIWLVGLVAALVLPAVPRMLPTLDIPLFHLSFLAINSVPASGSALAGPAVGYGWSLSEILLGIDVADVLVVLPWRWMGRAYAYRLCKQAGSLKGRSRANRSV